MQIRTIRFAVSLIPFVLSGCALNPQSGTSGAARPAQGSPAPAQVAQSSGAGQAAPTSGIIFATETGTVTAVPDVTAATGTPAASFTATPTGTTTATATTTPVPTPVILAPVGLAEAEIGGSRLLPRYWTNAHAIRFTVAAAPGTAPGLRPEVEIEPLEHPYTARPTVAGSALIPNQPGTVIAAIDALPEGAYHWQARLTDGTGHAGPWTDYYAGPAFRIDRTPPQAPVISSSTHPDQHRTYSAAMAQVRWTAPYDKGGIQGYATGIDRRPDGLPSSPISAVTRTVLGPLNSGDLYFHVRAVDWAGNRGAVATFVLHIDHRPPLLAHAFFDRFQFNPQFDTLAMHFVPNKVVSLQVNIRRQTTKGIVRSFALGPLIAGKRATVRWDGRNQFGKAVHTDLYSLELIATDSLGNTNDVVYTDLAVNYRRIVVHLSAQSMEAYDGDRLLRTALITSGNQKLPTPIGVWHVLSRYHPYKFISPWKKSSPFWYPTSNVNYALYFHDGGYFIHDAPWRTVFGPGTNSSPGLPGSGIYAGSHGCVETTTDMGHWLYNWAPIGTVVSVVP